MKPHMTHTLNMSILAYQTKGSIMEKLRRYEEAIEAYLEAKKLVEGNYGTKHKLYIELVNAINGARLRTKYFQNSNLGMYTTGGQFKANHHVVSR